MKILATILDDNLVATKQGCKGGYHYTIGITRRRSQEVTLQVNTRLERLAAIQNFCNHSQIITNKLA